MFSLVVTSTQAFAASNHSLSYSQVKKYQPSSKKMKFTYQQTYKGKKEISKLKYNNTFYGWIAGDDILSDFSLGYNIQKDKFLIGRPSSGIIYTMFDVPTRKGNIYKYKDHYETSNSMDTKIVSITQKVKVKAGTYRNCIVVKDRINNVTYYFAKNIGLILSKSKTMRTELVKVER